MQSLYMISLPPPGVPIVCMFIFNTIISQTRASHREEKDKRYQCGNSNSQYSPTTKGFQHPIAKVSQHYPKSHMSVSYLHSRSRNLQKGLHCGICLPLSGWTYILRHSKSEMVDTTQNHQIYSCPHEFCSCGDVAFVSTTISLFHRWCLQKNEAPSPCPT